MSGNERTLALALICASGICSAQSSTKGALRGPRQIGIGQVLSWLPDDSETVTGVNGPFPFPDLAAIPDSTNSDPSQDEIEARVRANFTLFLFQFKNGGLSASLKGKPVALAIEGSRHFRPPGVIGAIRYEGCSIVVFDGNTKLEADSFMKGSTLSARRFDKTGGRTVAVFEEQPDEDTWTTLVAFPRPNIVVVCTDTSYLRGVLARINGTPGPRALPDTLPEWKHVNKNAQVWGIRHYQRREAALDPTSPFQGRNAANIPDNMAVGVTFWLESLSPRMATVTYLSGNGEAPRILQNHFGLGDTPTSPLQFQIRLRQSGQAATEGSVDLSNTDALSQFLFCMVAMLGRAVYV